MEKIRWYDKNPLLKEVFNFIQKLDEKSQKELAKDILQIILNDLNINKDESINKISKNYNYTCKRWYDKDINLFSSFEIIKELSDAQQKIVIQKIIESALLMKFGKEN